MNKNQALAYFVSRGWTVAQAAGIVANLVAESGLNPAAVGDGGLAYGIAQWHPDRQEGFYRFFGRPIQGSSVEDQLAWVDEELRTTESSAGISLRSCTTAYDAGACVSEKYERPADRAGEAAKRGRLAESIAQGYVQPDTQPAAPIEERSTELPPQGESMGASILDVIGPIATAINPIAGILINAFTPILKDKITKEVDRHKATNGLGAQISDLVIQQAQTITGKADPLEAVAIVRQDPAKVAVVEVAASDYIEKYLSITAPLLDKIASYESAAFEQTEASRDAAGDRGRKDATDLAPVILKHIGRLCTGALLFLGVIMGIQTWFLEGHEPSTAMLTLVGPLLGGLFASQAAIVAYRFGEKRQSSAAAQTGNIIDNVTRSKAFQQGGGA